MKKNLLIALSAIALLTLNACNKAGKSGLLVPKEAAVVIHVNLASLSSKVSWDELKQTDWFKEIGQEVPDSTTKRLLEDPAASGLDTKGDQVIFISQQNPGGYFAWVGGIKDEAVFAQTVLKYQKEAGRSTTQDGDFMVAETKEAVLLWNKSHAVAIGNTDVNKMAAKGGWGGNQYKEYSVDSLKLFAKRILTLEGDQLLDSDKRFSALIKETGDVHFWVNSERLAGNSLGGMVSMMKVNLLLENNVATATLDFENGKIKVKANQYFGSELTDLIKKYPPKEIGKDVLKHLPADNVVAAGAFNYPPEGLKALLKLTGVDGMANGFIGKMGYSVDEFVKANKGDISFAISDFQIKQDTSSYEDFEGKRVTVTNEKPNFKFVAGISINDKPAFDKLVGIIAGESDKMPTNKVTYKLDNNWFVAGNDAQQVGAFLTNNNSPSWSDRISGHAAGAFVDIGSILKTTLALPADTAGSEYKARERKMLELSAGFWSEARFVSDIKDGKVVSEFEINLVDKNTNSLKQVVKYAAQLSALRPKSVTITDVEYPSQEDAAIDSAVAQPVR
jgi:hypothetical protein